VPGIVAYCLYQDQQEALDAQRLLVAFTEHGPDAPQALSCELTRRGSSGLSSALAETGGVLFETFSPPNMGTKISKRAGTALLMYGSLPLTTLRLSNRPNYIILP